MKKIFLFLTLIFLFYGTSFGQNIPSVPPNCQCSAGVAAKHSSSGNKSEIYIANCWCPPQSCAAAWSTNSKFAGVTLFCGAGPQAEEFSNCVDFTKVPRQDITGRIKLSSFELERVPYPDYSSAKIYTVDILDDAGNDIPYPPHALSFNPAISIKLPALSTRLTLTYVAGMGGGVRATWINSKGEYKEFRWGENDVQHKILKMDVNEPAGFENLHIHSVEHGYLKFCAFKDGLGDQVR